MIQEVILQIVLFFLKNRTFQITETSLRRLAKAQILNRSGIEFDRVFKEFMVKIDTGNPLADKHYLILKIRIRSAGINVYGASQRLVILCRLSLLGKNFFPPLLDLAAFGNESVSSQIHTVSVMYYGFGDTANL